MHQLKVLRALAPRAGFEPATNRLTAGCSTAELPGTMATRALAYNKTICSLQSAKSAPAVPAAIKRRNKLPILLVEATPGIEPGYTVLQSHRGVFMTIDENRPALFSLVEI